MKRFWSQTEVIPGAQAFAIALDGKQVKRGDGTPLSVPFGALATGIAEEWAGIGDSFTLDDFPLTRLTVSAEEQQLPAIRSQLIGHLASYGMTDLLCYRSEAPKALIACEAEAWDPWIDWAARELGVGLHVTSAILPIDQPAESRTAFIAALEDMSAYTLAGLAVIVPALGSLVLGLAVARGALEPKAAFACANLGALWQEGRWGTDAEANVGRAMAENDVALAARFMRLCQT